MRRVNPDYMDKKKEDQQIKEKTKKNDSQQGTKNNQASGMWQFVKNLFIVNDYVFDELFNLDRIRMSKKSPKGSKQAQDGENSEDRDKQKRHGQREDEHKSGFKYPKKAFTVAELKSKKEKHRNSEKLDPERLPVSTDIEINLDTLRKLFNLPKNRDVVIREFSIPLNGDTRAAIIYIDGAADTKLIDGYVLQPLMVLSNLNKSEAGEKDLFISVKNLLVPVNQVAIAENLQEIIDGIVNGDSAIIINHSNKALIVETKGWPVRGVGDPKNEKVTQGPQDAFNESFRQNLALVRKRIRSNALVTEYFKIGWRSKTDLALLYLDGVANKKIIREMRKRLKSIKIAYITDTGIIQQLVGDSPHSLIPTTLATERPDRVSAFLNEGHVAIIMDGSPFAIIAPITVWGLLHSPEDYYLNPVVGSFIRIIRVISFFLGVITPAFYIAITNYHPEMIPTDLLLAIAASRENVPFPVIAEVLMMEFSFELIREAGLRIPSLMGPTIGIVGALILGQAAVQANIVSPLLVIVVAVTALSSFTIPNIAFSYTVRLMRFLFIAMASVTGFLGIAFCLMLLTFIVTGMKSLGVSMLAPIAPFRPRSGDIVLRRPFFSFDSMPKYVKPQLKYLQVKLIRKWDPISRNKVKGD